MKTYRTWTAVAIVMLISMATLAQEKAEIWSWNFIEAEKGKMADLEKAIKDKTEKYNKLAEDPINTWRVMSGPRAGQLVRAIGPKDWSYYDKPNEGGRYFGQVAGPFIAKQSGREFYTREKDMSYNGTGLTTTPKFVEVVEYMVRPDKEYEFVNFVREVTRVVAQNKSKTRYSTYRNVSGTSGTKYVIIWGHESLTELDDNSEKWAEWYNKANGSPNAWSKDINVVNGLFEIYGITTLMCAHVPELSSK
jgi:hypothetical protein